MPTTTDFSSYAPGILVILGSIINFAANLLKVKDLERRVKVIEEKIHDDALLEKAVQIVRSEGRA